MLVHLDIRDFAIVDAVSLDLATGMTVLTGETGAGKSILVDAIGLLLGDRADSANVRDGAAQAEVSGQWTLAAEDEAVHWLDEQALADEAEPESIVLRRVISADGRSRAFINGRPVSVGALRELGEMLVEIHGQHAHQLLRAQCTPPRFALLSGALASLLRDAHSSAFLSVSARAQRAKEVKCEEGGRVRCEG